MTYEHARELVLDADVRSHALIMYGAICLPTVANTRKGGDDPESEHERTVKPECLQLVCADRRINVPDPPDPSDKLRKVLIFVYFGGIVQNTLWRIFYCYFSYGLNTYIRKRIFVCVYPRACSACDCSIGLTS